MLHLKIMDRSTQTSYQGPSAKWQSKYAVSLVSSQSLQLCHSPCPLLHSCSFYALSSWERHWGRCLRGTLTVNDSLGLGVLNCLRVYTQTVLRHLEKEATRAGGRGLWEQDNGGKRCRKEELWWQLHPQSQKRSHLHFWVPDKDKVKCCVRFLEIS